MKTHVLALMLLMFTVEAVHGSAVTHTAKPIETSVPAYSAVDPIIKVYFVSGMFSAEQRKVLWDAMQNWKSTRKPVSARIIFLDLGETDGLIDCDSCLTVVREEIFTRNQKWRSSFNRLRQDHTGRLVSAWIGLDRTASTTAGLRDLMLQALERGLGQDENV